MPSRFATWRLNIAALEEKKTEMANKKDAGDSGVAKDCSGDKQTKPRAGSNRGKKAEKDAAEGDAKREAGDEEKCRGRRRGRNRETEAGLLKKKRKAGGLASRAGTTQVKEQSDKRNLFSAGKTRASK
ncbi:hypothetical protein TGVAND_361590 [Toxoplasma gondii VAND]|uniref:Uncharacterized protein n=3 Tax=Toxoplasma gondii TaxID=5811 RepID=A0A2T6J3C5_TOXGO|nr:hypothetical protein TGP89_361590 [Toxoplasma gondii p89]KFH05940.1 hypothetical protein TGVAND_361590 [Toxoplasma gondii VAND]PUA92091.1 hypothetical protein TGBR9_361590 [Toxoplasma gondii TgCATBr9]